MKTATREEVGVLSLCGKASGAGATKARLRDWLGALRQAYLRLIGIPDYDGYLAHMAEHHPCEPVLSRRAFCARSIDRKYGKSGPRCC